MKSMNEYIQEKTGMSVEAQEFTHKMKNYFVYESCTPTKEGIKFNEVTLNEEISFSGDCLEKGKTLKSLEIRKNGWLDVCEDENNSYTIMAHNMSEAFVLPSVMPVGQPNTVGDYDKFPSVNAIQMGAMADLQKVISTVKRLSIEDANHLKSIMGPSLEEKILRTIIDACLFDTPPANGQQNGV